jgi:hypothetical protein
MAGAVFAALSTAFNLGERAAPSQGQTHFEAEKGEGKGGGRCQPCFEAEEQESGSRRRGVWGAAGVPVTQSARPLRLRARQPRAREHSGCAQSPLIVRLFRHAWTHV